mmetsp:Transcript_22783/g.50154  ORF Transcript_22783/g.50154 Transcript_22783/m.50154 type:complete len:234 (-) Transcript_22783:301-1002(-)
MLQFLNIWWPAFFTLGTIGICCFIDPPRANQWPPPLDLSGETAKRFLTSPWLLVVLIPMMIGLVWIKYFAQKNKLSAMEQGHMVWWMVNGFWFHTGCDIFTGLFMKMPVLTELYAHMSPAHRNPSFHDSRAVLDAGYALELVAEAPLAFIVLFMYWRRDPATHLVEIFAASVQASGTIMYYMPALVAGEAHCWLSYLDRSCGAVWVIFPIIILLRHVAATRPKKAKSNGKKKA